MIIWGTITIAALTAYLRTGWKHAQADLPAAWTRARTYWGPDANPTYHRDSVRWSVVRMLILWLPIRLVRVFEDALVNGDPKTIAQRHREQAKARAAFERRTAQLEAWNRQWMLDHPDPLETL